MKIYLRIFLIFLFLASTVSVQAQANSTFVFVKIAEAIMPIERGSKYEDTLDSALKETKLGEVTGGGSLLSKDKKIEWVGVDVELVDLKKGIPFLKKKLIELGAPKGSTLEYMVDGKKIQIPVHVN